MSENIVDVNNIFYEVCQHLDVNILIITDDNQIVGCSSTISTLLGYAPHELIGQSIDTLLRNDPTVETASSETRTSLHSASLPSIPMKHANGETIAVWLIERELDNGDGTSTMWAVTPQKSTSVVTDRLNRYETILNTVGDGIYELDIDGNIVAVNDVIPEVTGYSRDELIGSNVSLLLDDEDITRATNVIAELVTDSEKDIGVVELTIKTADGDTLPVEDRIALYRSDGEIAGTIGIVRDISDRMRRLAALERQRNELLELSRINEVIRDLNQALVTATTKEEIYESVCERLVQSDSYVIAWIGRSLDKQRHETPISAVGIRNDDLEVLSQFDAMDGGEIEAVHLTQEVPDDGSVDDLQDLAEEYGFRSTATIPIRFDTFVYGFLHLYADREMGFTKRERTILNELGETIGLAINAIENRSLLQADTLVELEFSLTDSNNPFVAVCDRHSCTIELKDGLRANDDSSILYFSIEGAAPEQIVSTLSSGAGIRDSRILHAMNDGGLIMVVVTDATAIGTLLAAGARIQRATISGDDLRIVVHTSRESDISTIVSNVDRFSDRPSLVSRRDIKRPIQTSREYRRTILDNLTDKQRTTLQAAYQADYFTRPRPVAGTSLADNLDIAPSTFHHHLQAALEKTVGSLFNDEIGKQS